MKRIRKSICRLLVICMLVTMLPMSVFAESSEIASGTCGDNLTWSLTDGILAISGIGPMVDYSSSGQKVVPWYYYRDAITSVVVGSNVTSIGNYAFAACDKLVCVEIGNSISTIGRNAFINCRSLTSVTIPDSVTTISSDTFYGCTSLVSVDIGNNVTTIGGYAFANCTSLTNVRIGSKVSTIGGYAFKGCTSLININIPDSVTGIYWNAFEDCDSLTDVTIPENVSTIGDHAFFKCDSLTNLSIGNGVTTIGESAFWGCKNLTNIIIGNNVQSIGEGAFGGCDNLLSVNIPKSVTDIGYAAFRNDRLVSIYVDAENVNYSSDDYGVLFNKNQTTLIQAPGAISGQYIIPNSVISIGSCAFWNCDGLASVTIPNSVTTVGGNAFFSCSNLTQIVIPDSVNTIGYDAFDDCASLTSVTIGSGVKYIDAAAFYSCVNLKEIVFLGNAPTMNGSYIFVGVDATAYYPMDNNTWNSDVMQDYGGNITWIAYDDQESIPSGSNLEITGLSINKLHENFYIFQGDSHVYNMDSPNAALYLELNQITVVDNDVISPADIVWTSSDETVLRIISSGTEEDLYVNLRVEGLTEGTATLTAANPAGETLSFDVTVVKPNALSFTNIYDTKQYYSSGAFYSAASSISDSVEIFVQFENALIDGYHCKVESDLAKNVSDVEPITLTATVSGSDLSFDRNSYQNTYTTTYDPIKFGNYIYDILMLFPSNVGIFKAGTSYSVNITLESDSFTAPIEEIYSFTVYDAEKQRVDEHISFINNSTYKASKQNIYGTNMLELKDDPEYNWSVVTSLDFDNYYEIVLADLLVDMLDVYQVNTSIVPTVLKEWHGTYKSLLGDVTTMVKDSYSDILDVSEMKIDKVLKVSKYTKASEGIYADDDVYQVVLDMFGNVGNVDKIQTFFAAVDDTKSAFSIVKLTGDVVKDFVAWGNSIAVLNAFVETDENFKQVFRQVANNIPDSEKKMKEAIEDYLNYSEDFAGQFSEIYDSFCDLGVDVALDTFDGIVGKKLWDWAAAKAVGWIGKIPISGGAATFSSTTAYASLTTAIGSVTTGISLGLCLSDLICDSSDKAAEMSKIIAMSEYAPYIIQALEYYEDNLCSAADNNAVDLFEKAFGLHQASQSYIMDHTVKALEVKAGSILQSVLGNDDYDVLIANILVQKDAIDELKCCGQLAGGTIVNTKKVIAIKCPVNVYIYDENGVELVRIVNDTVEYVADGLKVFVQDGEKYVAMPASQVYSIKIVATDEGTMTYAVLEYNEGAQLYRTLRRTSIPLEDERIFTGVVVEPLGVEPESYALTYDNGTIIPRDVTTCNHIYANACDATCNDCGAVRTTIHTWKTPLSHNATQHWTECSVCGEKKNVEGHIGGSADCQNNAVCTDCQQPYGELTGCDFTAEKAEAKYLKSAATCKDVAVYYKSCAVCGKTGTETFTYGSIDKTNHTGGTEVRGVTAESCTVDGYTGDTHCKGCGEKLITGQTIPATAHKTATAVEERASTCKTNGVKAHFHCRVCNNDFLEKTVTAVAQTADDLKLPLNAEKHEGGTEIRNAIPMTCTDDGYTGDTYCRGCAVKIATGTAIPAEHKLDKVTANPATHDTAGNIEHYTCSVCAKLFNDDKATKELTADEVVIAKGEHSYSETFQHDENGHWKGCECGSKIEEGAHTYGEWVVTMKADVDVEGSKERTCTICGYKQTEKLPATTTPATGDNTHIGFLFILMLISACGMITMLFVVPRKMGEYQH